jgi:vacuolar protein sorting-associated protein IST1
MTLTDFTTEAYEILELMTDLLHERVKHLGGSEQCPIDLLEAVATILWASSRVDISELEDARKQLIKKFGKEFYEECKDNANGKVNARVLLRLNIMPPEPLLVRRYLIEIANQYNVEW